MNYYNVPQDVEVADQVIGPLNIKQFGFMIAGVGFGFGLYAITSVIGLPMFLGILLAALPLSLSAAMAFIPYNSRPLDYYIFPVFQFFTQDKLLLWRKEDQDTNAALAAIGSLTEKTVKKVKIDPNEVIDTGVETKHRVRQELSRIKKVAALLDGGIDAGADDIGPKTAFDGTAGRNREITQMLSASSAKVAETREPVISQVATLSPTEAPDVSLPDLSAYSFRDMETAKTEENNNG